jgi:hypothetical protein
MIKRGFILVYYVEGKEDLFKCVEYCRRKEGGWVSHCVK